VSSAANRAAWEDVPLPDSSFDVVFSNHARSPLRPCFGLRRVGEGDDGAATCNRGYGEWIRLLHANGLVGESIWVARKA